MESYSQRQFRERFYTQKVIESHAHYKVFQGRDALSKTDINILTINDISRGDLDEILSSYQNKYDPATNVNHIGYCLEELDHGHCNFNMVYEATKILEDHLKERTFNLSNILTYEEVRYLFYKIAHYQKYLKDKKEYYGCLQRKNLRIDSQNNIKLLLFPLMKNTFDEALHRLSFGQSIDYNVIETYDNGEKDVNMQREFIYSPKFLEVLKKRNGNKEFDYEDWVQNDIFVMAMWCLYFFDNKILRKTLEMDQFYIDFKAIASELKNVKFLVNTNFADLIKNCLRLDINKRLSIDYLSEVLNSLKQDIRMGVNNVREAKLLAQENFDRDLDYEINSPLQEKKYFYNKEVNNGVPRNVAAGRHLQTYANTSPQKNSNRKNANFMIFSASPNNRRNQSSYSPMKPISFANRSPNARRSRQNNNENFTPEKENRSMIEQLSPFAGGGDKEYKPYFHSITYLKRIMLHFIEKEIMPVLPYKSTTDIKIEDKLYKLKEYEDSKHIGFILYDSQDIYFGEVLDFKRHGKGFYINQNNEQFYGDFFEDLLEGDGQYYYKNGNICLGSWSNGYFHGVIHVYNREKNSEYKCVYNLGRLIEILERKYKSSKKKVRFETELKCKNLKWFFEDGFHDTDFILRLIDLCKGKATKNQDVDESTLNFSEKKKIAQRQKTVQEKDERHENEEYKEKIQPFVFLTEIENRPEEIEMDFGFEFNYKKFDGRDLNTIEHQWTKYRGSLWDGKRHGLGELIYKNGHHYKGEFDNNVPHGFGVFYIKNDRSFCGNWNRGVLTELTV